MDFQHGIFFDLAKQQPHTEGNAALPSGKQTWQFHFICFWCEKHECIAKQQYFELPGWIRGRCMPLNRAYVWETSHGLKICSPVSAGGSYSFWLGDNSFRFGRNFSLPRPSRLVHSVLACSQGCCRLPSLPVSVSLAIHVHIIWSVATEAPFFFATSGLCRS